MRVTIVLIVMLVSAVACTSTIKPISGTPTAEQVISNARRVARELDSYRSTLTISETTHYPDNPGFDYTESTVHNVEMERKNKYRFQISPEFEVIYADGVFYSRQDGSDWVSQRVEDQLVGNEYSPLPPAHPETTLDSRNLGETRFAGLADLNGRAVYLIEGLVPPPPKVGVSAGVVLSDTVRIYIDTVSFEVVRVEVDRDVLDNEREDVGYQVIPGAVEIETVETYEYFDHNADVEITVPDIEPAA